jgi:putative ABC transport system permease protein
MLRTFWRLQEEDPGFRAGGVLALQLSPVGERYATDEAQLAFYEQVMERAAALPGARSVGAVHLLPLSGNNWNPSLRIEERPGEEPEVDWRVASPGYFRTLEVPLLRGRMFSAEDRAESPRVALVNRTLASRVFPGADPIGKRVLTAFEGKGNWVTIVGVVGDTKDLTLSGAARPQIYRPLAQNPLGAMTIMVRTAGDPMRLARPVRALVASLDRDVPVSDLQPLARVVADSYAQSRTLMLLLAVFGALALGLGAVGIFGVMSYVVGERAHEFGVRMALGASARDVLRLVARRGLLLALAGVAIGLLLALGATRLLAGSLHGVRAVDPPTFLAVSLLLALVALLASWVPARRAARTDPAAAFRDGS